MSVRRTFSICRKTYQRLIKAICTARYSRVTDQEKIFKAELDKYRLLGLDHAQGIRKINQILGQELDLESVSSHLVLFSSLSVAPNNILDVLEIGTYKGETANLLSRLFPAARVTTVDLPVSDPIFSRSYLGARGSSKRQKSYEEELRQNVALKNITYIESNTFFLLSVLDGQFDLVWLDGGHKYPEVAWDACQAYWLCRPGGLIVFDDVIRHPKAVTTDKISGATFEVLTYIQQRTNCKVTYFLKRLAPEFNSISRQRKYIAVLQKPAEILGEENPTVGLS